MTGRGVVGVAILLLLAGCAGASTSQPTTQGATELSSTATQKPADAHTPTSTPTATEPPPENPWRKVPIVVATRYDNDSFSNYDQLVRDAVNYWQTEGRQYAAWEPAFTVEPDSDDPDLIVEFTSDVERCDPDAPTEVAGCASVLKPDARPSTPEIVQVVPGSTNYHTRETIKHELGHVLGLWHGDEPVDVMEEPFVPFSKYAPDASYQVYHDAGGYAGEARSREQARHALDYYEDGAEGWVRGNISFEFTDDEDAADIHITVTQQSPSGSVVDFRDRSIELNGMPTSRHGWHVGYWLGYLFGADEDGELPPAFDEPESDDRTDWW